MSLLLPAPDGFARLENLIDGKRCPALSLERLRIPRQLALPERRPVAEPRRLSVVHHRPAVSAENPRLVRLVANQQRAWRHLVPARNLIRLQQTRE